MVGSPLGVAVVATFIVADSGAVYFGWDEFAGFHDAGPLTLISRGSCPFLAPLDSHVSK
jgi:hypothetical protein